MSTYAQNSLSFLFKIDFIKPNEDVQPEIRRRDSTWIPPTLPGAIATVGSTGWVRWTVDGLKRPREVVHNELQTSSLFYNSENHHFLGVPFDCRRSSVQTSRQRDGLGWRRVMFRYTDHDPPVSVMSFDSEYNVLAGTGSTSWMPQLIPETYSQNQDHIYVTNAGIAGDLSLLLAFAAFSSVIEPLNVRNVLAVIATCFKPPKWKPHILPTIRKHRTGVIVSISLDPDSEITEQELWEYQKGIYGPIIEG
ncbi:hypothetical protein LOZ66_000198 [Ophidiomyces ophidiicola]|nr:hypothetical protein LOZ66_000198 [Ophidiomyces ophidiicola]